MPQPLKRVVTIYCRVTSRTAAPPPGLSAFCSRDRENVLEPIEFQQLSPAIPRPEQTASGTSAETMADDIRNAGRAAVPPGWHRPRAALLRGLKATATPARQALSIDGPCFDIDRVHLQATPNDRVVAGLLRKAKARMMCTCLTCGKVGKLRRFGLKTGVFCASCYTERLLRLQIVQFSRTVTSQRTSGQGVISEALVPPMLRHLVPEEAWTSMPVLACPGEPAVRVRYLTLAQCEQLMPTIHALRATVEAVLMRATSAG